MTRDQAFDALLTSVRSDLASLEAVADLARDEATSGESRAENKYDTRATEASYLAAGQGRRLADLRRLVAWLEARRSVAARVVGAGALVALAQGGRGHWVVIAPQGGPEGAVGGRRVRLLSVQSPLGAALDGRVVGDEVEVEIPTGTRTYVVQAVD